MSRRIKIRLISEALKPRCDSDELNRVCDCSLAPPRDFIIQYVLADTSHIFYDFLFSCRQMLRG